MPRSLKNRYFVDSKLRDKVLEASENKVKKPIKTWARRSMITPDFVGLNFELHNGKSFVPVYVTENMIGHKLGEFACTRNFKGHSPHTQKTS